MMSAWPVHLYIMRTDALDDPREHAEWERELPEGRWQKAVLPIQIQDRRNSAGAGWLLRYVFEREGVPFSEAAVTCGPHGKPCHEKLHFNLSHSGEYVICAVGQRETGCDIQKIKPCREKMVRRFFSDEEQEYILSAKGQERDLRFITLWSRKESLLKRTGAGLTRELPEISCLSGGCFYEKQLEDYVICVCCGEPADDSGEKFCGIASENVLTEYVRPSQCLHLAEAD